MVNLTALATAASVISIIDFQGRAVDLVNGAKVDFTPVQSFSFLGVADQQWQLQSTISSGASPFKIVNSGAGSFLSFPSANQPGAGDIANIIRQQVMVHPTAPTTWNVVAVSGGFNFIEAATGLAMTSWAADPQAVSASNPLTLEPPISGGRQQIFSIVNA